MSVHDRIEDSRLLFAAGRLDGALLSVLTAIAGTSRKRYPEKSTPSKMDPKKKMGSGEAFVQFLRDEESRFPNDLFREVPFNGASISIAEILWKYLRCDLSHEAELNEKISVDYGDFLIDCRGTSDHVTFSSELFVRLSYLVETAAENAGAFPDGLYDRLSEPIDLKQAAIIRYTWDGLSFECLAYACSLIREIWDESGEELDWLHMKAHQLMNGLITTKQPLKLLLPTKYVTEILEGPQFHLTKRRTRVDVGIFRPDKPAPIAAVSLQTIRELIARLQVDLLTTTVVLKRPKYGLDYSAPAVGLTSTQYT